MESMLSKNLERAFNDCLNSKSDELFFKYLLVYLDLVHDNKILLDTIDINYKKTKTLEDKYNKLCLKWWQGWENINSVWEIKNKPHELSHVIDADNRDMLRLSQLYLDEVLSGESRDDYKYTKTKYILDIKVVHPRIIDFIYNPIHKTMSKQSSNSNVSKKIELHKFEPKHYIDKNGILHLSPTAKVEIAKNKKVKRPKGQKYEQCRLLECLFKSVNSLNKGVKFSTILGVSELKIGEKQSKKISNTVSEINKKVTGAGGPKRLIFYQEKKVYIDKSYLL